jgi:uncharacterized membrane protein YcaP (DUF421 family)
MDPIAWLIRDYNGPLRVLVVGLLGYVALIALLRLTGKRTLSKMNAFDFIVTVALGSTLAATLLNKSVPLANGVTAVGVLILVQYAVAWMCARTKVADRIFKSQPRVILWQGNFLPDILIRERLSEGEVLAAIRLAGHASYGDVHAVVLETTGSLSVIKDAPRELDKSTLQGVAGVEDSYT